MDEQDKEIDACEDLAETLFHRLTKTVSCPHCRAGVVAALVANLALEAKEAWGALALETTIGVVSAEASMVYQAVENGDYGDYGGPAPADLGVHADDADPRPEAPKRTLN